MADTFDLSMMDPHARRFLAMVQVGGTQTQSVVDAAQRRRSFEQLMRFSRAPEATVESRDLAVPRCGGAIPIRLYSPVARTPPTPGLIYFHGGGLVAGDLETHDNLCRRLAHEAGCRIVAVAYRLAPEHPFPAAIIDALAAVRWIDKHAHTFGLIGGRIGVGGDSGGATLATIAARLLREKAIVKAQILLCPVLDFGEPTASKQAFGSGFLLDAATMAQDLAHYAPRRSFENPRVSPLREPDLAGVAPAVIHTAGFDPLLDEGAAYAAALADTGVPVRYICHDSLVHHFYCLDAIVPAARAALSQIASDIAQALA